MCRHVPTVWPRTIRDINDLAAEEKSAIYQTLLPDWVFSMFEIDAQTHMKDGQQVIRTRCPSGSSAVEISVYHTPQASDPVLYLHMGDSFASQLLVLLVIVNDPNSLRFNIDIDEAGRPTQLGTDHRNLSEERRAMEAGLAPGQIRRGLRIFRTAVPNFEQFVRHMGHELFFVEPLFYHNAIMFESYGFAYSRGLQQMKIIHEEFLPGGTLHQQLAGETHFRAPTAWQTAVGRSWAIHDGILGQPFTGIQMYKRVGKNAGIRTFPDVKW